MNNINALAVHLLSKVGNYITYGEDVDFPIEDLIKQVESEIEITTHEFENLSVEEAKLCGFKLWSEETSNLYLIPAYLYKFLPSGLKIESINGEKLTIDHYTDIDCDQRFGCLAFGVRLNVK